MMLQHLRQLFYSLIIGFFAVGIFLCQTDCGPSGNKKDLDSALPGQLNFLLSTGNDESSSDEAIWLVYSPDGDVLAAVSFNGVARLWDLRTGVLKQTLSVAGDVRFLSIAFSPDGKMLASGTVNKVILLWDLDTATPNKILKGHAGAVSSVAFSPDGRTLISSSDDATVRLWNVKTGILGRTLKEYGTFRELQPLIAISPDGKTIAKAGDGDWVALWDPQAGTVKRRLIGGVRSLAFSPDGRTLAGADSSYVLVWDVDTGNRKQELDGDTSLAFSPDGKLLATYGFVPDTDPNKSPREKMKTATSGRVIKLWDSQTGELRDTLQAGVRIVSIAFSPDGNLIAGSGDDGIIRIWNWKTSHLLVNFRPLPASKQRQDMSEWIAFIPDGYYSGSPGAGEYIRWQVGDITSYNADYNSEHYRPDLVEKSLQEGR